MQCLKSFPTLRWNQKVKSIKVIKAIDGELITESITTTAKVENNNTISDQENDILKLTVVNRYQDAPPAVAFIKGFGLQNGAIASCVGHDSHNIIAVGTDDEKLCAAVNLLIENKGGIAAIGQDKPKVLPLPIAGIMTNLDGYIVAKEYAAIDAFAKEQLLCQLRSPFMTLSFMALLVIPNLKLSDMGLFDGRSFSFVPLFE